MAGIVSLLPSLTETVCALGARDRLVGRSHECDFPSSVASLPVCTAPRFDPDGESGAIDDRVQRLVRDGLSIYEVGSDTLKALAPEIVLTQDQCEVCAASLDDVEAALASWVGGSPRVLSVAPSTLGDVFRDVVHVADAIGVPERGRTLADDLTERVSEIGERSAGIASVGTRPRVACIEWLDPLMGAGNWIPELVRLAGGEPVLGGAGEHSPWVHWEAVRRARPDVLVLMPCGFDLARTLAESRSVTSLPGFGALPAATAGRVFAVDGNQYFNRPGPRLVESLEILAELVHPGVFRFGHEGTGWRVVGGSQRAR